MKFFLGLSSQYSGLDVLRHTFAMGNEYDLSELRAFLAAHYGATFDHVAVYANGRTALSSAIKAVTKRGDKVVVTSLTCYAVIQAVKAAGCIPVFADVDKNTLHYGKKELEKAIENETNVHAVIVQNNLGIPADISGIEEVAKAHKLVIIEDLAHCAGVKYADGREAGTVGRVAALSFGKGKSIDTVSGGAVIFTDPLDRPVGQPDIPPNFKENFRARLYPLLCLKIRAGYHLHPKIGKGLTALFLKLHLIKRSADGVINPKLRLTFWQSRLALRQLQSLPHRGRRPIRDFYLVNNRNDLLKELEKNGFFFRDIWYDKPVAPERYFKKADYHPEACPVATELATQIINLPTWYDLAELKPAMKLISRELIVSDPKDEALQDLDNPNNLTETEKKAKIRAEKAARARARKEEHNNKREKKKKIEEINKKHKEEIKRIKADGAPDEEVVTIEKKESPKEKLAELVAKIPKQSLIKKVKDTKKSDQKDDKATKIDDEKNEQLSSLEQSSGILGQDEPKEKKAKKQKEEKNKPTEKNKKTQQVEQKPQVMAEKKQTEQITPQKQSETTKKSETHRPVEPVEKIIRSQTSNSGKEIAGMRVAPRKLTEREKLKQELQEGRKAGPSVI